MEQSNKNHPIYKEFTNSIPKPIIDNVGGGVIYRGYTLRHGVDFDNEQWMIEKETTSGTVTIVETAGGRGEFKFAWNDRTTLRYSR